MRGCVTANGRAEADGIRPLVLSHALSLQGDRQKLCGVPRGGRRMYEELVKELRKESCGAKTTSWWRAADAIEKLVLELSKANNSDGKTSKEETE